METALDEDRVVAALAALAHEHRLRAYRLLVEAGSDGLPAGAVADQLEMPPSSLTFHLQHLLRAGLVSQRRVSRQLIYAMVPVAMNDLVGFLTENCCGNQSVCAPVCNPAAAPLATMKMTGTTRKSK